MKRDLSPISSVTKFLDRLANGEPSLWKILFLYDLLARMLLMVPMILLNEAMSSPGFEAIVLSAARIAFGLGGLIYFGACILGAFRNLRRGENGLAMTIVGYCYVFVQGILYFGSLAQIISAISG